SRRAPSGSTAAISGMTLARTKVPSTCLIVSIVPGSDRERSTCAKQIERFKVGEERLDVIRPAKVPSAYRVWVAPVGTTYEPIGCTATDRGADGRWCYLTGSGVASTSS